ncbi:DUF6053 domain-containing protein [Lysobacter gummosus]|uniref:DUF6053 domain-containing protein n=1 Tax=Lysobacter gummosus TaxID=262324 RepID=UPI00362675D1
MGPSSNRCVLQRVDSRRTAQWLRTFARCDAGHGARRPHGPCWTARSVVGGASVPMLFGRPGSKFIAIRNKSIGAEAPPTKALPAVDQHQPVAARRERAVAAQCAGFDDGVSSTTRFHNCANGSCALRSQARSRA